MCVSMSLRNTDGTTRTLYFIDEHNASRGPLLPNVMYVYLCLYAIAFVNTEMHDPRSISTLKNPEVAIGFEQKKNTSKQYSKNNSVMLYSLARK